MKTLLIRSGGMGDTALSMFAAQWLSSAMGRDVTVMFQRRHLEIAGLFGFNAVSEEECDFQSAFTAPSPRLVSALKPFESVVVIKKEAGELSKAATAEFVQVDPLPPLDCAIPYPMFIIQEAAKALVVNPPEKLPSLTPRIKWRRPLSGHLVFTVGSGSLAKSWPLRNFMKLIETARSAGFETFTAIMGPAEVERTPSVVEELESIGGISVLICPSIHGIGTAIASASVFVGADSGVTHLAAMIGAPTVALFGPTNPAVWGPIGDHVTIIRSASGLMEDVTAAAVADGMLHYARRFPQPAEIERCRRDQPQAS